MQLQLHQIWCRFLNAIKISTTQVASAHSVVLSWFSVPNNIGKPHVTTTDFPRLISTNHYNTKKQQAAIPHPPRSLLPVLFEKTKRTLFHHNLALGQRRHILSTQHRFCSSCCFTASGNCVRTTPCHCSLISTTTTFFFPQVCLQFHHIVPCPQMMNIGP